MHYRLIFRLAFISTLLDGDAFFQLSSKTIKVSNISIYKINCILDNMTFALTNFIRYSILINLFILQCKLQEKKNGHEKVSRTHRNIILIFIYTIIYSSTMCSFLVSLSPFLQFLIGNNFHSYYCMILFSYVF